MFYVYIFTFLILSFCFLPFSNLLSFKPVNYNIIKSYFIILFFIFFSYFFWYIEKFICIHYFIIILITPFVRRQFKKAADLQAFISFLNIIYLFIVMIFVLKSILFLHIFFLEIRNLYSFFWPTKIVANRHLFFKWLQPSTQVQHSYSILLILIVILGFEQTISYIHETIFDPNVPLLPADKTIAFRHLSFIAVLLWAAFFCYFSS